MKKEIIILSLIISIFLLCSQGFATPDCGGGRAKSYNDLSDSMSSGLENPLSPEAMLGHMRYVMA